MAYPVFAVFVHRQGYPLRLRIGQRRQFRCWLEYRPKLRLWDVMCSTRYGWQEFPETLERYEDLFSAISALRRLNAFS